MQAMIASLKHPPNESHIFNGSGIGGLPGLNLKTVAALIRSRFTEQAINPDDYVDQWISKQMADCHQIIKELPLNGMNRWGIDAKTGNISHCTGRFFSFIGVQVRHRTASGELEWDQPIIEQPEVGILGILAKNIKGTLHFCLQAKEEPGNINSVQLSPTVQATFSNYTCAHGGSRPLFVDHFLSASPEKTIFAKLQTEDGGRFLYKSNRNMIVNVDENELEKLPEGFIWLTLRQISNLMKSNNLVHATSRSVLSSLLLPGADQHEGVLNDFSGNVSSLWESIQWLDNQKAANHMLVKRIALNSLKEWHYTSDGKFAHKEGRFFRITGIDVASVGREVTGWNQPILANSQPGIIGLLMKMDRGRRKFLLQAKAEAGNSGAVQMGPTVQFATANYLENPRLVKPFLFEEFAFPGKFQVISESMQSEEGARFLREANCHRVLLLPEGLNLDHPGDFRWMTEDEVRFFIYLGEKINSCARSIISCLL